MSEQSIGERNLEIVASYSEGVPGPELAERHGLSRQRISQILNASGAIGADEARALRNAQQTKQVETSVQHFAAQHGDSLHALATAGATRYEAENKFAHLSPETPRNVVKAAIKEAGVLFNVNREEFNFSKAFVEAGVWYVLASSHKLQGNVAQALSEISLTEMEDIAQGLSELSATKAQTKEVLLSIAAARHQLTEEPELTISRNGYQQSRQQAVDRLNLLSTPGGHAWPPTSQTVMKRLGNGYWAEALGSLGITTSKGRNRGLLHFREKDYHRAVADFLNHCRQTGATESFDSFEVWVDNEDRLRRQRPSGPAVRLFYKSWTNAKRAALTGPASAELRTHATTGASSPARTALHDASSARSEILKRLSAVPSPDRAGELADFTKNFMSAFETRRRTWFRQIVKTDPSAVSRRLDSPGLKKKEREHLEATPPDIDAVLTDRYLDRMLGKPLGVRNADSWLSDEAQNELDNISEFDVQAAWVLRLLRNFYTHDSSEAERRLTIAITDLSKIDSRFRTDRRLTWRLLSQWLLSEDANRFAALSGSILAAWRGMLTAEAFTAD